MIQLKFLLLALLFSPFLFGQDSSYSNKEILNLYFDNDSYKLSNTHQRKIDSILASKTIIRYECIGFASFTGTSNYNQELSINRAKKINAYLIAKGLKGSAEGKGADYKSTTSEDKQRRVELTLFYNIELPDTAIPKIVNENLISKDSLLSILQNSDTLSLKSIQFFGGTDIFYPTELPPKDLYYLAEVMDSTSTMKINIQGHVCCGHDFKLSEKRAQAVYYFLKAQGIAAYRMKVEGFSNFRLKVPDTTPENNQINRRVEIIITNR